MQNPRRKEETHTKLIGIDLEHLGLSHEKPNLAGSLMLQELHGVGTSLLPLVLVLVESVKL